MSDLTLRATDPLGMFTDVTFSMVVSSVNDPPTMTGLTPGPDPAILDAGFQFQATPVLLFDAGAAAGLNSDAQDWTVVAGVTIDFSAL